MRVVVGTQNGMFKVVDLNENLQHNLFGTYELSNAVESMLWDDPETEELVAAGFANGAVQFWNPRTKQIAYDCGKREGKVKGLYTFAKDSGRMVVSVTDTGKLEVCPQDLPEDYKPKVHKLENHTDYSIWRMRPNPISSRHFLYAGKKVMPTLFDLEEKKVIWRGQFGDPHFAGLKQRQFFTDIQFMPHSGSVFATGSRYREFRIYDLRIGFRPVLNYDVTETSKWEFAMISLAVTDHTPNIVYATEATGKIACFDLRTGKQHKIYRDGLGTVKSLAFHPTERVMAAAGMDRYLRVYDIDKRMQKLSDKTSLEYKFRLDQMVGANMHNKMFLKQKLTAVIFYSEKMKRMVDPAKQDSLEEMENSIDDDEDEEEIEDGEDKEEEEEEDDEEIWASLPVVGDDEVEGGEGKEDVKLLAVKEEPYDEYETKPTPIRFHKFKDEPYDETKIKEENGDEEAEEEEDDDDQEKMNFKFDDDNNEDGKDNDDDEEEDEDDDDEDDSDGAGKSIDDEEEGEFSLKGKYNDELSDSSEESEEEEKKKATKKTKQPTSKKGSKKDNKKLRRLDKEKKEKKFSTKRKKTQTRKEKHWEKRQRTMK